MKKLLFLSLIVGVLFPGVSFATYNDVVLTSDTIISVNGITLNVSGSSSSIASITVDTTSFSVSLEAGSTFKVNAPSGNDLAVSPVISSAFYTCTETDATLEYKDVTATQTVVITPSAATCTAGRKSSGSVGSSGSSSSSSNIAAVVAAPTQAATIASLQAQLNALLVQLAALQGAATPALQKVGLSIGLSRGSSNSSVKTLQQFLNTHGFVVVSSGPGAPGQETDFFGKLTEEAVKKFQVQYGIATSNTPGYGYVGPKTRAKINELSGN